MFINTYSVHAHSKFTVGLQVHQYKQQTEYKYVIHLISC
jgi:hypothetical protein